MTDELAFCNPKVTCVVEADLETVWKVVRQWSTFYWLKTVQGAPCEIQPYEGQEHSIGAVRTVEIGSSLMFERLVAVDEETHIMKWRVTTHEETRTPFEHASYINCLITMELREITHRSFTFCDWQAEFFTEQEFQLEMHGALEGWMAGAFKSLQHHMTTENPTVDMTRRPVPPSHASRTQHAEDHISRFADLHIGSGQYGIPVHDHAAYISRGMPAPAHDPRMPPPGKPMGTTPRQGPVMGGAPPSQSWQSAQVPPSRRAPPGMSAESARAVHDWAANQQQAHHRHRHGASSTYAPSHMSERSGSSFDGMDPAASRMPQAPRYQSRSMSQGRPDIDPRYEQVQYDPRSQWENSGAPSSMMYDQPDMYDPRVVRQNSRARSTGGPPPRGTR